MSRAGVPWTPDYDYGAFEIDRVIDAPFMTAGEAAEAFGLKTTQAVRNMVQQGRLPVLRGSQPQRARYLVPRWAVDAMAAHRRERDARTVAPQSKATSTTGANEPNLEDGEDVRRRIDRLEYEKAELARRNADLVFAWNAAREAQEQADTARRVAGDVADLAQSIAEHHLAIAERTAAMSADAAALQGRKSALEQLLNDVEKRFTDALSMLIMPSDAQGA